MLWAAQPCNQRERRSERRSHRPDILREHDTTLLKEETGYAGLFFILRYHCNRNEMDHKITNEKKRNEEAMHA
jgi:hypothetical protein